MSVTRRRLLWLAGLIPVGVTLSAAAATASEAIRLAAGQIRPRASGTSATRCALCGGTGHNMLDPRCPAARKVV